MCWEKMPVSTRDTSVNWLVYWWWPNQPLECWAISPCGALPPIVFYRTWAFHMRRHAVNIFFYVKERNVKKIELIFSLVMSIAHPRAASSRSERMLDAGGN